MNISKNKKIKEIIVSKLSWNSQEGMKGKEIMYVSLICTSYNSMKNKDIYIYDNTDFSN